MIRALIAFLAWIMGDIADAGIVEDIERAEAIMTQPWAISAPKLVAATQRGKASWYGRTGRKTANGERYPTAELTCAHRWHAFGTMLRVTRADNGRSIRCRVNDRGPFAGGRIVDLNPAAALGLGIVHAGVVRVIVEALK